LDALAAIDYAPDLHPDRAIMEFLRAGRANQFHHKRIKEATRFIATRLLSQRFSVSAMVRPLLSGAFPCLIEALSEQVHVDTIHEALVPWMDDTAFLSLCDDIHNPSRLSLLLSLTMAYTRKRKTGREGCRLDFDDGARLQPPLKKRSLPLVEPNQDPVVGEECNQDVAYIVIDE
jgi:hypothetical protein